jgi:hypothetical protein
MYGSMLGVGEEVELWREVMCGFRYAFERSV